MRAVTIGALLLATACGAPAAKSVPTEVVVWQELGSWSGRGSTQTETFVGLTGSLRIHWTTTNEDPKHPGSFRLILASSVSGRDLLTPVDHQGVGEGTVYAAEDPRAFHMVVQSDAVDWSFTVEEAAFVAQSE